MFKKIAGLLTTLAAAAALATPALAHDRDDYGYRDGRERVVVVRREVHRVMVHHDRRDWDRR